MTSGKRLALAFGIGLLTRCSPSLSTRTRAVRPTTAAAAAARRLPQRARVRRLARRGRDLARRLRPVLRRRGHDRRAHRRHAQPAAGADGRLLRAVHPWDDGYGTRHDLPRHLHRSPLQYWVDRHRLAQGGLGFGHLQFGYDGDADRSTTRAASASCGAAGVEVVQSYNFALDLPAPRSATASTARAATSTTSRFMIGVNWY